MKRILLLIALLCQVAILPAKQSQPQALDERGALKVLFKATNGKQWHRKSGWMSRRSLDEWEGITCNDEGKVVKIELSENNLQGKLPDIFHAFTALKRVSLRANSLRGELPHSLTQLPANCRVDVRDNRLSTTTLYVPRSHIADIAKAIICYPQQESHHDFRLFIDCEVDRTHPQGFRADGFCRLYQKATEGKGVDIFIVGEGYDRAQHAVGGTADYWLERTAEAVFDIEPYNKLRHLFNVYIVYAYSPERGVGLFDSERMSRFGYWQRNPTKSSGARFNAQEVFDVCRQGMQSMGVNTIPETIYVQMVVNSTNTGLYRGMMYRRRVHDGSDSDHFMRIALNPTNPTGYNSLIWHEFGGHAFGHLLDEYVPREGAAPRLYKREPTYANVDTESDPKLVKWARFIEDPRYAHEKIGVYRGAGARFSNLYRATETSIMRSGGKANLRFNAPSRAEIYRQVMEKAYPGWRFDYEEFVKFDLAPKTN